jgi:hypothetical protein
MCSCATRWPAPTTPISRCFLTKGEDRLDSYQRLAEILRRTNARQGPGHQPGVPLRAGQLVPRRQHQCAPDHPFHRPLPDGGGRTARNGGRIDLEYAYGQVRRRWHRLRMRGNPPRHWRRCVDNKQTLLLRPDGAAVLPSPMFSPAGSAHGAIAGAFEGNSREFPQQSDRVAGAHLPLPATWIIEPGAAALMIWDHDHNC